MTDEWVFAGRYRVDAPIGSGGMGEVWSGYDLQLDRRVAVKLMHQTPDPLPHNGSAEHDVFAEAAALDRERFLREVRTTARLELPGIPAVYDSGVDEQTGRLYLVMQLLYGQTLAELIAEREYQTNPWPICWAAAVAAQVAATLVDVHRVDVVHRDIKPSNLMVVNGGLVKVLDFGVAILRGARALPKLTQLGVTVGSPPYMPPEQVLGNPVVPASDVYALGCVLHEVLTGRVPFAPSQRRSYQDHHVNTAPEPVRRLRPDVPAELDELVLAMLAKAPAGRPDAEAVYDALLPFARAAVPAGRSGAGGVTGVPDLRDPQRPFLRPLAPAPRTPSAPRVAPVGQPGAGAGTLAGSARQARPAQAPGPAPLTIDEALEIRDRVAQLIEDSQFQQAIDALDSAVERAGHDADLAREMRIELATTLYVADEFSRAAELFDEVLPGLGGGEDATLLRYYAGVSHAETGDVQPAIQYLTEFLAAADPADPLYRDATYQLGVLLPAAGRIPEGLARLEGLRPILVAEYGPDSIHVASLDRRIAQIRSRPAG